jgi:hypothetical protein
LPAIGQIAFYDREGKVVKRLPDVLPTTSLNLSPDGTHVAVLRNDNLLNIDIASGASKFVATNVANGLAWSPDSAQIVYRRSDNTGFIRVANGSEPEVFYQRMGNLWNWSGDGRFILLGTGGSLAALATATKTLVPVSGLPGGTVSRISPDGRFVAYISSAQEVLVRALDSTASASVKIGDGSFGMIRWRSDGKELYYLTAAAVMAVPVTAVTPEFKTGAATRLFAAPAGFQLQSGGSPLADASADGQRFVFLVPAQ